jgi:SAM-dependent methyltransferase
MSRLPGPLEDLARGARALAMRGDRVECPICGGRFRGFLPGGPDRRPDAQCPGCGSLERQRLLWLYLKERTALFTRPHALLHVAPERDLARRLSSMTHLRYVSGDLDSPEAAVRLDLQRLPFRDRAFDAIVCSHVLEHVTDAHAALRELRRVLAPAGWAILQSPIDADRERTFEDPAVVSPEDRLRVFGQRDHARIFGRDYPDWIRAAGFAVTVDPYVRTLGDHRIARHGLDRDEEMVVGHAG